MRSGAAFRERLIPLDSDLATIATAGGKGANLARLAQSGFPVPPGFIMTTCVYEDFVATRGIAPLIESELETLTSSEAHSPVKLEESSERIARLFALHPFDEQLTAEVLGAYHALGEGAVAVRSSATAEDLPDLSFAGQQETYLNVVGDGQLITAIRDCWASLWTPRAIDYRTRNRVTPGGIAVVVQQMVQSEAAGVMFTAHPVTGDRSRIVIEATRGLGESLVSGSVEPDRFTVDTSKTKIVERFLGAKEVAVYSLEGGGVRTSSDSSMATSASISDDEVLELARLGRRVASLFGAPQDIEWALADGRLRLLQSRPITSLFPLPESMPARPLQVMLSFAAIQGVMDPFTPLGCDMIRQVFASASHIFGYRYHRGSQRTIATAGGRLWVNVTSLLRSSIGRRILRRGLALIEPTVMQALVDVWDDPQFGAARNGMRFETLIRVMRFAGPLAGNIAMNMMAPHLRRDRLVRRAEGILEHVRSLSPRADDPFRMLAETAASVGRTFDSFIPPTFIRLVAGVATGMASLHLLNMTARRSGGGVQAGSTPIADLALEATRGTPNNPTTEMDLALWQIAKTWQQLETESSAGTHLEPTRSSDERLDAKRIAELFEAGALPAAVQSAVASFLARYGARGLAELDIGRPRWRDEPRQLFEMLEGYLGIRDTQSAPDAVFARSAEQAAEAIERIAGAARKSASGLRGVARAARVRFAAERARAFLGFREYPKFFAVRMMDVFRTDLLAIGTELVEAGCLSQGDDLFYLTLSEQQELGDGRLAPEAARSLVDARRAHYRRELRRRRIPRLLLSDGRAFYDGLGAGPPDRTTENVDGAPPARLSGSPVSPGTAEGRVRVVHDPRQSRLQPGEIMICRGTDPSWTPLFLLAGGLVMEVGGMMTHGAVVAREYGIPAVVGVHEATTRLTTGTQIRLDGSSGLIELLETPQ